jgi:chaperone required for assembly of F1-ATPase
VSKKRFYEAATVADLDQGWGIELDCRGVRTPSGGVLGVPVRALAEAMAQEWNAQGENVIPSSMPLCGLVNATIDRITIQPEVFHNQIEEYSKTDLICYWAENPTDLLKLQHDTWQPLIDWMKHRFGAEFRVTQEIVHLTQPDDAITIVRKEIESYAPFHLAAFTDMVTTLGSVIIALALYHNHLSVEQAFNAAFLDELYQADKWGDDLEAVQRREGLRSDLESTTRFLALLG